MGVEHMLEDNDTAASADTDAEAGESRRPRARRSASRAAGPPPVVANPFMVHQAPVEPPPPRAVQPATPAAAAFALFQVPQLPLASPVVVQQDSATDGEPTGDEPQ